MPGHGSFLEDRVVLITGGAGNLGRHVVQRFLSRRARVHVPVLGEEDEEGLTAFLDEMPTHLHLHRDADLTDAARVDDLVHTVREAEGKGPEILLNLAGGFWMGPLGETDPEVWTRMWERNASTAFHCARAVFPDMRAAGWGRIVNVSAFPALERGQAGLTAYGAAKAAVLNLTQTLAKEGVGHGITVNAVLPSIIDTPQNRKAMPDADTTTWLPPEEIAGVFLFLVSEEARILNGAALPLTLG